MQGDQEVPVRPAWQLAGLFGGPFAALSAATFALMGGPLPAALVAGLLGGASFGGILGPVLAARQRTLWRRILAKAPPLPPGGLRQAVIAVRGGPIPDDPAVRRYAIGLAAAQLLALQRRPQVISKAVWTCVAATVACVLGAVLVSPAWLLPATAVAGLLAHTLTIPGRVRRRYTRLKAIAAPPSVESLCSQLRTAATGSADVDLWVPDELTLLGKPVPAQPTGIAEAVLTETALSLGLMPGGSTPADGGRTLHFRQQAPA